MLRHHRHLWLALFVTGVAVLAACAPSTTNPAANIAPTQIAATNAATTAATATPIATATTQLVPTSIPPTATMPPTSVPLPSDQDLAQLKDQVLQQLAKDQTAASTQPIEVNVLPLTTTGKLSPLYAVYGTVYNINPDKRPIVTLYQFTAGQWDAVQQVSLDNTDYLDNNAVQQVMLEPDHIWLEVQSGAGAHSGCYDLIAFDPINRSVSQKISSCSSSPGAGYTADVNGDGQLDVVLDATDYYVFCYACGVTKPQYSVLAWDGQQLKEVTLTTLSNTLPVELQQLNNDAVRLAQAGLWKDAQSTIEQAKTLKAADPIVRWNAGLIDLHAKAYHDQVDAQSYPLLNDVFYGDYAAALNVLRPYPPDQIFSPTGPVITGTVADGWIDQLSQAVIDATNAALQAKPDLAAAYFLRGWAEYLVNAKDPAVLQDIEHAVQLAPDDKLFSDSVKFLK